MFPQIGGFAYKRHYSENRSSEVVEPKQVHSNLLKYLERKGQAHDQLSRLKVKVRTEEEFRLANEMGRDPGFGMIKDAAMRDHHLMRGTHKSNGLHVARLFKAKHVTIE